MKLDRKTAKLICELEREVGTECYNGRSYNGYTGGEGCSFRYKVSIDPGNGGRIIETKSNLASYANGFPPEAVRTMKYKFGANELNIGIALENVLNFLEERYGLDFNELENKRVPKGPRLPY